MPDLFSFISPITSLLPPAPTPARWHRATLLSTASEAALLLM